MIPEKDTQEELDEWGVLLDAEEEEDQLARDQIVTRGTQELFAPLFLGPQVWPRDRLSRSHWL